MYYKRNNFIPQIHRLKFNLVSLLNCIFIKAYIYAKNVLIRSLKLNKEKLPGELIADRLLRKSASSKSPLERPPRASNDTLAEVDIRETHALPAKIEIAKIIHAGQ